MFKNNNYSDGTLLIFNLTNLLLLSRFLKLVNVKQFYDSETLFEISCFLKERSMYFDPLDFLNLLFAVFKILVTKKLSILVFIIVFYFDFLQCAPKLGKNASICGKSSRQICVELETLRHYIDSFRVIQLHTGREGTLDCKLHWYPKFDLLKNFGYFLHYNLLVIQ